MKPVCARAPIFAKSHKTGGPLPGQKGPDSTALIVPNCPSYFFRRRFAPLRVPLTTRPSPHFHTHPGEVPPATKRIPGACFRGCGRIHPLSKPVCAKLPIFAKSRKTGVQLPPKAGSLSAAKTHPRACFRGRGRPHLHSKPVCAKSPFFAKSRKTGVQLPVRWRPDPAPLIVLNMTHFFSMHRFAPLRVPLTTRPPPHFTPT